MSRVISAAATELRVLAIPPSFRYSRFRSIRIPFSMEAQGEKFLTANPSYCVTNGGQLPIESQVLRTPGFRQEPEVIASGNSEIPNASDGIDTERSMPPLVVLSFYKFAVFADYKNMRMPLKNLCEKVVRI